MDELPLLLWENPPVCPCLSIPGNVPGGMAPNTGICGDGEKGPTSPVGCHLSHTQGWGYNPGPPSPSLLEHRAQGWGGVCVCPLQSTLGSPRPGVLAGVHTRPRWTWLVPLAPLRRWKGAHGWHWGMSRSAASVPWFVLTLSPHGAECCRICPAGFVPQPSREHTGAAGDTCVIPLGFHSCFLGATSADGAKSLHPGEELTARSGLGTAFK